MAGSNFRSAFLPLADALRGIPTAFGIRIHVVAVSVRTWTGARAGLGTSSTTTTGLKLDLALANVKVRNVSQQDAIASGGTYTNQDLVIGPITPPYTGSAVDNDAIAIFDPPHGAQPTEVFFRIQGPGYSDAGDWFKKIAQRTDQPFRYMIWVRKTGIVSP